VRLKTIITTIILVCACDFTIAQNSISLSGEWQFQIDRMDIGISEKWFDKNLPTQILLPGSMLERHQGDNVSVNTKWIGSLYDSSFFYNPYMAKYRKEDNFKLPFFLTPEKHYVGAAWYRKIVNLPESRIGQKIFLFLERPHIETELWINGEKVGKENSLTTAHQYDITSFIKKGENVVAIRIDNRIEHVGVGADSHSVTDQTQGDWNGIVGKIELRSTPIIFIEDLQVFPNIHNNTAKVVIKTNERERNRQIRLTAELFNSSHQQSITKKFILTGDSSVVTLSLGKDAEQWDEFHPALYRLTATLDNGTVKQTIFGMREITIDGKMIACNGRKIMLRGTVENCDFPLTGYPPMDENSWEKIFRKCRSYGINHIRFHSYCPPEAAFLAADIVGMYLQPEGPSWPNHGVKLGNGTIIDTYLMIETQRMVRDYGNHPSFCMLSAGNEPSGNWVKWVSNFVDYWKSTDDRRIYTGASVGNGWQWQPKSMYHVKAGARGLDEWNKHQPSASDDFRNNINSYKGTPITVPYISHETGQWCAFPDIDEISQYTGVYQARNFEIFRDLLNNNKMGNMAHKFLMSSGKLQTTCYKYEIEKILRTPDYAGFQLLGLNDYSGQGTALVGVLNVFFKEKGYCTDTDFTEFCSPVVNLARIPKFTYQNTETLTVPIEIANYSASQLEGTATCYSIIDDKGHIYASGTLSKKNIPIGNNISLGTVNVPLSSILKATKLTLKVETKSKTTQSKNHWDFWVYPASNGEINYSDIYITDTLDNQAIKKLRDGGKVLITAAGKTRYGNDIVQYYTPVFWNTSWFKMRPPHTTGAYIDNKHPVFDNFPTDNWSSLQWWELLNKATVMNFNEFPKDFQPTVQSIDTWFVSRKAGMLFEAKVLNGKLLMTTIDITSNLETRIVARQLRKSIVEYMKSDKFRPGNTINLNIVKDLFEKTAPPVNMFTHDSPDELKPKIN
jgi:hypothetical protein